MDSMIIYCNHKDFCFYRHDILSVATITRAIQGSNVDTLSGYLEEWGVPMRHDSYTQDIYI